IRMSKDVPKLRKRIFEVVNFVNMVYKPLLTFVALVGLEIWTDADKITLSSNTEQNLDNFMNWRNKNLINKKHDCAHLISGIDFAGDTIGLAFVGALCTGFSVGVVQDYTDTSALVGATLAHELGHNLGMSHDTTTCKSSYFGLSCRTWSAPKDFSTCSRSKYEEFLLSRGVDCLLDKPDYKTLVSPPVCGNGFVEAGEQCDCGTCTNCCCNASTCAFSEGSQCAEGECCEDCKILGRSRECRRKRDECDLAEYCDGASAVCPEDVFSVNGLPCDNTKGFCYNGECPQRSRQCNKMYGPGEGALTLLDIQGLASKKKHMLIQYFTMTDQSGTLTYFTKDYGQVETGTKCAAGKVRK
uniref:ADAM metallopeptidase domain 28 n=1 Tax=Periophthalmus magnuspinnatus TaxID=409849 RepID=A0A3B4ASB6_9GOBI